MDTFFTQKHCDRCGKPLDRGRIMSMYNTDCICLECADKERKRFDYSEASKAEFNAVRNGNLNFEGIVFKDED